MKIDGLPKLEEIEEHLEKAKKLHEIANWHMDEAMNKANTLQVSEEILKSHRKLERDNRKKSKKSQKK